MFPDSLGKLISTLVFGTVGDLPSQKAPVQGHRKFVQGYDYPTVGARSGKGMSPELEELLQGCTSIVSYRSTLTCALCMSNEIVVQDPAKRWTSRHLMECTWVTQLRTHPLIPRINSDSERDTIAHAECNEFSWYCMDISGYVALPNCLWVYTMPQHSNLFFGLQ